jgi:hypothetical protein
MPCYEHFVSLQKSVFVPLVFFLLSHLGTGIYYIDSTALAIISEFSKNGGDHPGYGAARCRMRSGR